MFFVCNKDTSQTNITAERNQIPVKENLTDTIVAGIDEAGLGPILGPLVVSAAAFSIPEEKAKSNMWPMLSDSVSKNKKRLAGRLLICDSKKAYTSAIGIGFLEKTVLTCLKYFGTVPDTAAGLVEILNAESRQKLLEKPWYKKITEQKINFNTDEISISAGVLKRDLEKNGMEMIALKSCCIEAAEYNELIDKVRNKSRVVFHIVCRLINEILRTRHKNYHIVIDRQGGRMRYAQPLRTMFGEMALRVIEENDNVSSYELLTSEKQIKIDFVVRADDYYLPVGLASMTSKYLREQMMISLNNYFLEKCSELKPTAGYWTDGNRFIEDLKTIAPHIQYDARQLIRSR